MTSHLAPICRWCVHRNPFMPGDERSTCAAFPGGIPDEIIESKFDHRYEFPGDDSIVFESEEGREPYWPVYFLSGEEAVTAALFTRVMPDIHGLHFLHWNPDLHPRGRDGKFIEKHGWAAFDWPDVRTGRTHRFHGEVIDVVPDPHSPGNPNVHIKVFHPSTGKRSIYYVKPGKIDTIDVKAHLNDDALSGPPERTFSALAKVRNPSVSDEVEQIARRAQPGVSFRADLGEEDRKKIDDATDKIAERWPNAPLVRSVTETAHEGMFQGAFGELSPKIGHKTDSAVTINSGFHDGGYPDGEPMLDPSPRGKHLHEFGHALDDALRQDDRDLAIELDAILERQDAGAEASPLGDDNTYEFVAEAVVDSILNGDDAKPASKEIAAVFDRAFGKNGSAAPERSSATRRRMSENDRTTRDRLLNHEAGQLTEKELTEAESHFSDLDDQEKAVLTAERAKRIEDERRQITPQVRQTSTRDLLQLVEDDESTQMLRAGAAVELERRAKQQREVEARRVRLTEKVNAQIADLSTDPEQRYQDLEEILGPLRGSDIDTDKVHDRLIPPDEDSGRWTMERHELHEQMWQDLLKTIEDAGIPQDRDSLVLGGLPGAGKSSTLKPGEAAEAFGVQAWEPGQVMKPGTTHVSINPDNIKEMLVERGMLPEGVDPRMGGLEQANFIHEESSVLSKLFSARLADLGYNMVLDNTLNSSQKMELMMGEMAEEGYTFRALFVDVPIDESLKSIKDRFVKATEAEVGSGRFVPSSVLGNAASRKDPPSMSNNRDAFDYLVQQDWFHEWMVVDNTGISQQPRAPKKEIVAHGTGQGTAAKRVFDEADETTSTLKAAMMKAAEPEQQEKKKRRTAWWGRMLARISPSEAPSMGQPGYELPGLHPGMEHPAGPTPGCPGGELPPDVEAPISVSDAPSGFI